MKKTLTIIFFLCFSTIYAENATFYVFAKSGLNLRAQASTSSTLLATLPYGEPITLVGAPEGEIMIDNIKGHWVKVKYKTFTGYMVNIYLLPHKPPLGTLNSIDEYFAQISTAVFTTERFSKIPQELEEGESAFTKTFYKNGMEVHSFSAIEYGESQYYLPFWSKAQAFNLLKYLKEFKFLNDYGIGYPTLSKVYKKGEKSVEVKVSPDHETIEFYFLDETLKVVYLTVVGDQAIISVGYGG